MSGIDVDKDLYQAEQWAIIITWKSDDVEVDMTGYTIAGQIRTQASSDDVVASFVCDLVDSPETAQPNRAVRCVLPSSVTVDMPPRQKYLYDIIATSPASVPRRLVGGAITIHPRITR